MVVSLRMARFKREMEKLQKMKEEILKSLDRKAPPLRTVAK